MFLIYHNTYYNIDFPFYSFTITLKFNCFFPLFLIWCSPNAILNLLYLSAMGVTLHFLNTLGLENTYLWKNLGKILPSWIRINPHFFIFSEFTVTKYIFCCAGGWYQLQKGKSQNFALFRHFYQWTYFFDSKDSPHQMIYIYVVFIV